MTKLTIWDHLFVVVVFLLFPIYSALTFRRVLEAIRERGAVMRLRTYRDVVITTFSFLVYVVVMWWQFGRDWTGLGIRVGEFLPNLVGLIIASSLILAFVMPLRRMALKGKSSQGLESQLRDMLLVMPQSRREELWFRVVSTNAGVSEELVYRGFLIWYLSHFMALGWAACVAVLVFGFAHVYQGIKLLPGILFVSAVAVSLYLYTESLLIPILFHIGLDAAQGFYIARIPGHANTED